MNEDELQRFARHLSLPQVGMRGQETLLNTRVTLSPDVPAAALLTQALTRSGLIVVTGEADITIEAQPFLGTGLIQVGALTEIGAIEFLQANRLESSASLAMKELWFAAAIASEILLWRLGHRPAEYTLHLDYPELRILR